MYTHIQNTYVHIHTQKERELCFYKTNVIVRLPRLPLTDADRAPTGIVCEFCASRVVGAVSHLGSEWKRLPGLRGLLEELLMP